MWTYVARRHQSCSSLAWPSYRSLCCCTTHDRVSRVRQDVEFALQDGTANVRTSSRLGYLDLGVNAKRFNWFAKRLGGQPGWKTAPLLAKEHMDYFYQNRLTDKDVL